MPRSVTETEHKSSTSNLARSQSIARIAQRAVTIIFDERFTVGRGPKRSPIWIKWLRFRRENYRANPMARTRVFAGKIIALRISE
jgi:hypothetical protein